MAFKENAKIDQKPFSIFSPGWGVKFHRAQGIFTAVKLGFRLNFTGYQNLKNYSARLKKNTWPWYSSITRPGAFFAQWSTFMTKTTIFYPIFGSNPLGVISPALKWFYLLFVNLYAYHTCSIGYNFLLMIMQFNKQTFVSLFSWQKRGLSEPQGIFTEVFGLISPVKLVSVFGQGPKKIGQ